MIPVRQFRINTDTTTIGTSLEKIYTFVSSRAALTWVGSDTITCEC